MLARFFQRLRRKYGDAGEWARVGLAVAWHAVVGPAWGEGLLISVVLPVRNRKGLRLKNALASLAQQSLPRKNYEVVVVDFGGQDGLREWLKETDPSARYVYVEDSGPFNEAKAKNAGVRAARAEIVCCTNADILFAENFLETVCLAAYPTRRVLVECNRFNLEKADVEERGERLPTGFMGLVRQGRAWRSTWARGDCQAFRKEFMAELGGYDEAFVGWGYLDLDLENLCRRAGWRIAMVNAFTSIAHQGHDSNAGASGGGSNKALFEARWGKAQGQKD